MTNDSISKQVNANKNSNKAFNIHFKQRKSLRGLFIKGADYQYLQSKNLWRIVTNENIELWEKNKDETLSRIFNGIEFTRLSE